MKKFIKKLTIRYRANRAGIQHRDKFIHVWGTPKLNKQSRNFLRISKGKQPFQHCLPELNEFTYDGACCLEVFHLTTGKPITECPEYYLARMAVLARTHTQILQDARRFLESK